MWRKIPFFLGRKLTASPEQDKPDFELPKASSAPKNLKLGRQTPVRGSTLFDANAVQIDQLVEETKLFKSCVDEAMKRFEIDMSPASASYPEFSVAVQHANIHLEKIKELRRDSDIQHRNSSILAEVDALEPALQVLENHVRSASIAEQQMDSISKLAVNDAQRRVRQKSNTLGGYLYLNGRSDLKSSFQRSKSTS